MEKLDKYEKDILESFEKGEWEPIDDLEKEKERLSKIAKNTYLKNKRINIRISEWDLIRLKAKSMKEGIPYQSLVSSLIHQYITGKLVKQ